MDKLLFGISGLPIGPEGSKFKYSTGIEYLSNFGLDAMELPFVRSVNVTKKNHEEILQKKEENNFYISAHGSYYINLNAKEDEKKEKSLERIIKGAEGLSLVNGKSLVFHPGFYLGMDPDKTYNEIKSNLEKLPYIGVDYRLETTGKGTQFGSLQEIVQLSKDVESCKPCIDFAHIHARNNGCLKEYDDFKRIFNYIGTELGNDALNDIHIHVAGINYGPKGEKNHLPFKESDFKYELFVKALIEYNVKGCIICESPILEHDAILLKKLYENSL
ncbi:TIM barrel protein [Oceanirhabdus sp. W0125-5]|uniref:TIM barrel protein n=1 Tax=Oceanirhabdus sp. W0125-5 TaxID=2999116 RepID=UPI0022F33DEE|nr:TIM barrel protein [Oceanirhabdus sp. W0125-5]WBW95495.1 TIM barrel protein [Oceanirhabdus sp. W0125-5]